MKTQIIGRTRRQHSMSAHIEITGAIIGVRPNSRTIAEVGRDWKIQVIAGISQDIAIGMRMFRVIAGESQ